MLNLFISSKALAFSHVAMDASSTQSVSQPRSQGLSSYRPQERFAPGGGKMKDPGNEVFCQHSKDILMRISTEFIS